MKNQKIRAIRRQVDRLDDLVPPSYLRPTAALDDNGFVLHEWDCVDIGIGCQSFIIGIDPLHRSYRVSYRMLRTWARRHHRGRWLDRTHASHLGITVHTEWGGSIPY